MSRPSRGAQSLGASGGGANGNNTEVDADGGACAGLEQLDGVDAIAGLQVDHPGSRSEQWREESDLDIRQALAVEAADVVDVLPVRDVPRLAIGVRQPGHAVSIAGKTCSRCAVQYASLGEERGHMGRAIRFGRETRASLWGPTTSRRLMADSLELLEAALTAWQAADVDRWLEAFSSDARFFVPGRTSVSGDHTVGSVREVALRLMRAHGDESGMWVIESYSSPNGAVALADQKVVRGGVTHHYHQMLLHELRPGVSDRFAHFWVMVHEYDAFESAWS